MADDVTLNLPDELVSSIISKAISKAVSSKMNKDLKNNDSLFLRQMKKTQKIYGTDPLQHLVSVCANYFTQSLTVEEALKLKKTAQ